MHGPVPLGHIVGAHRTKKDRAPAGIDVAAHRIYSRRTKRRERERERERERGRKTKDKKTDDRFQREFWLSLVAIQTAVLQKIIDVGSARTICDLQGA